MITDILTQWPHLVLWASFFALGFAVAKGQEPEPQKPPPAPYKVEPPNQAIKLVGRRGGMELPEVEVKPWKPS